MNSYKNLFLQQSYQDNTELYFSLLRDDSGHSQYWDYVVLSASNASQAASFQEQIERRRRDHRLPVRTRFLVIPDPEGKRVGSGGATLNVLREIRHKDARPFQNLRILLIHSGGDARRTPQYSACGKIFSPVPRVLPDGHRAALFDEFMIAMCGIPARISSGLLVCSGDVELLFNPLQLDFYEEGAAAFSIKEPAEIGKNHGIFLGDGHEGVSYVAKFLHKQTVESLKEQGAVDKHGLVNIDTGAVLFSGQMTEDLFALVDSGDKFAALVNDHVRLSFYADFLYPLATEATLEEFYYEQPEGDFSPELREARELLWSVLHKYKLKLIRFAPASFLHFGTTREVRSLMCDEIDNYRFLGWEKCVNSNYKGNKFAVSGSYISLKAVIGEGSYIEDSYIHHNVQIGKDCVISGLTMGSSSHAEENGKEGIITVPDFTVLHGLKLKGGRFVVRAYGVDDNPKENRWFGKAIDMPLWNKPLFQPCTTISEAVNRTLAEVRKFLAPDEGKHVKAVPAAVSKWNSSLTGDANAAQEDQTDLLSLEDSFNLADGLEILPWQDKLNDKIEVESLLESIDRHVPVSEAIEIFHNGISRRVENWLTQVAEKAEFSQKIRIYYYLASIPGIPDRNLLMDQCFGTLRNTILTHALHHTGYRTDCKIVRDEVITRLPVRVNWGGGWSDTPPYCMEHGGTVLNAAVKLNGQCPIEVTVRKLAAYKIVLESTDIGSYGEFTEVAPLQDCQNPSDPFALHKAALIACGIIPYSDSVSGDSLEEICQRLGGGVYINTRVINIPKGSGLGTSSILSGACVKSLFSFLGIQAEENDLYNTVLCMEQIMSTGGGWQDQVGGLAPGIKMVTTDEGLQQQIVCTPLQIHPETLDELNERFALIYTGQRRLARNLLRDIVGKYIGNDPVTVDVLYRIQQAAVLMRLELEKGHVDGFAELLNEHWELSKKLDRGCTNTCIDQLFHSIEDLIDGRMICGAGGGGFVQVILKKGITRAMLQERLDEVFGESGVGVWECEIG